MKLCTCGHTEDQHYVEPLFLKGIAPCWVKTGPHGRVCDCMAYRPQILGLGSQATSPRSNRATR